MKKLDIYISKNFIKAFLLSLCSFLTIFILAQMFKVIKYITDGRMTVLESLKYIGYLMPKNLISVTPLAVLLGGLMCINRMASSLEIISLKTSGISFRRIVKYPIIISFIISMVVFYTMGTIYPKGIVRSRELKSKRKIEEDKKVPTTKDNAFLRTDDNIVFYMKKVDAEKNQGEMVQILEFNKDFTKLERIITSKLGIYDTKKNVWIFPDARVSDFMTKKDIVYKNFSKPNYTPEPKKFITLHVDPEELSNVEIRKAIQKIRVTGGDVRESLVELGKRYSFPFASFVVCFLGLSLGSRYVRGASAINIALCVGLGFGYYVVQSLFETWSKSGVLNPFIGGWIPNIIFLAVGIYFMREAEY